MARWKKGDHWHRPSTVVPYTGNSKLAGGERSRCMGATYKSIKLTCPEGCPLKDDCYADRGLVGFTTHRLDSFMGTGPAPDVTTDSPVPKRTSDSSGAAFTEVKADTEPSIKQPIDTQTQNAFSPDAYVRPAEPVKYYKQPSFAEEMKAQENREASLSAPATPVEAATVESIGVEAPSSCDSHSHIKSPRFIDK